MTDIRDIYKVNENQTRRYTEIVQLISHECDVLLDTIEKQKESDSAFEIPPACLYISIRLQKLLVEQKNLAEILQHQLLPSAPLKKIANITQQIGTLSARLDMSNFIRGTNCPRELTLFRIYREAQRIDFSVVVNELMDLRYRVESQYHKLSLFCSEQLGDFRDCFSPRHRDTSIIGLFCEQLEMYSQSCHNSIERYVYKVRNHPDPLRNLDEDFAGIDIVQQYSQSKDINFLILKWRREGTFVEKNLLLLFDYICKRNKIRTEFNQRPKPTRSSRRRDDREITPLFEGKDAFPFEKEDKHTTVNVYVGNGGISNITYGKTNFNGKEND